jgi:mono/diheme cytochrome c family protein
MLVFRFGAAVPRGHGGPRVEPRSSGWGRLCPPYAISAILAIAILGGTSPAPAAEAELIEQGRDLYGDFCATCHGRDMVNTGTFSFDLRKFPKDDFPRFRNSVLDGKNQAMPAWRDKITDEDLAALWAYVRSGG